jgi:hypothetical protein
MPATRDRSQNTTFIFSNFYELYQKAKNSGQEQGGVAKGLVLKTTDSRWVSDEESQQLHSWSKNSNPSSKIARHLQDLRQARKRLSFLMAEMDEILKSS